jgi:hypothetical protein
MVANLTEEHEELKAELVQLEVETGSTAEDVRDDLRTRLEDLEVALAEARFHTASSVKDLETMVGEQLSITAAELDSLEANLDTTVTAEAVERDAMRRARASHDTLSAYFADLESASEETAADMLDGLAEAATDLERKIREAEVVVNG